MRRSFDGLMSLIRDTYQMDPYSDALYLFCGRKRNTLKALYFDQTGFVLCTKRLDKESFQVELQVIHRLLLFFLILLFQ